MPNRTSHRLAAFERHRTVGGGQEPAKVESVREGDLPQLARRIEGLEQVPSVYCATEASVGRSLRGHEHMFAWPRGRHARAIKACDMKSS